MQKAVELLPDGGIILVINEITIASTIEDYIIITLKGSDNSNIILKHSLPTGFLINIVAGGNLTLENITIDGQGTTTTTEALIKVATGGSLTLKTDATLQNN